MMKRNLIIVLACLVLFAGMAYAQKRIRVETPLLLEHGWMKFNNEVQGFTGTISVATGGTFYGFINGVEGDVTAAFTFHNDDTDGDYLMVADSFDGHYSADFGFSAGTSGGGEVVHCAIFINSTETAIRFERDMSPGGDVGDAGRSGMLVLAGRDKVRLKCTTDGSSKTIEVKHAALFLLRLGD